MTLIAGVDEVGRGPLAGPVLAVAVILEPKNKLKGLKDSKKMTVNQRNELSEIIKQKALSWAYGVASVREIDQHNILNASLIAMSRAIQNLSITPTKVLVDGNRCPQTDLPCEAIVKGDDLIKEISAASIVAKVMRDYLMNVFDKKYPWYGFAQHKGYPTKLHLEALKKHGASPIHRRSFSPVRQIVNDVYDKNINEIYA